MTRLYIVEGLPCSGKSSTARFIAEVLEQQGRHVCHVDEGTGKHPAITSFMPIMTGASFLWRMCRKVICLRSCHIKSTTV